MIKTVVRNTLNDVITAEINFRNTINNIVTSQINVRSTENDVKTAENDDKVAKKHCQNC